MVTVVGSLKGGSGKSTITFNLAIWLTMAGVDLLVIDADPQATLSDVADVRAEEEVDPEVDVQGGSALTRQSVKKAEETLIDIGTASMENLRQAISLADRVVVPVPPSQADIWSTQRFIQFVHSTAKEDPPEILGFINRGDTHHAVRETDEAAAALISLPGIRYVRARLSQRTVYRRSFSEGLAVFELEPRGKGATEFTALAAALYPHLVK